MKKTLIMAWATLMLTGNCFAQINIGGGVTNAPNTETAEQRTESKTYKVKLGNKQDNKVLINVYNSTVKIEGYNGDDVILEGSGSTTPAKRAEGLKPLYNQEEDNTGMGLSAVKEGNTLRIVKASRTEGEYTIRIPRNAAVVYQQSNWMGGDLSVSDLNGEIELKVNNGDVTLNNVSGPVVAHTVSGDIKMVATSLNQSKPNALSTVSGAIDVTLPANTKANFKLKSTQGEIYTDFDMEMKKEKDEDGLEVIGGGGNIDGKINGGGVEISVQSVSSDIFIRKKK